MTDLPEPHYYQTTEADGRCTFNPYYTATQLAAARQQGAKEERVKGVNSTHTLRQHVTDGQQCWCNPKLDYKDPVTGAEVWIHKEPQ